MSAEQPTGAGIHTALIAVMSEVTAVGKDSVNSQQGYAFRGSDAVVAAVAPALRRHGVLTIPVVEHWEMERVPTGIKDTMMHRARVTVAYRFLAKDGTGIDARVVGEAVDSADKATACNPRVLSRLTRKTCEKR